jgi:uncharacterized protein with HEPN domain
MQLKIKAYLYDIQQAVRLLTEFTTGKSYGDYAVDAMLRSAVERQFEIAGEALAQLARVDEQVAAQVTKYRRITAFRNILIHGYARVDDRLVWDVIESKLPTLSRDIDALLQE